MAGHDHGAVGAHTHGSMDIAEQKRTFAGFLRVVSISIVVVAGILLLLTTRI